VFDIELSLEAEQDDRSQDRIDLILFHTGERRLRFFEVKTFANEEVWPKGGGPAAVCGQIARYKEQIARREVELLDGYQRYARLMASLTGVRLPEPKSIDPDPELLLIGYDTPQQVTVTRVLEPAFRGLFHFRKIGDPRNATQNTLAKWWADR
jgi:hypothetical protein